jgi:ribonuclease HII
MLQPFYQDSLMEAGCDEAGRGCFAGPVFAAAVILPRDFYHPTLNDSKQLTAEERQELKGFIKANAIAYAVAMVDNDEIDQINILRASFKAMHLALDKLRKRPELLLIDGHMFYQYKKLKHQCIVQGDGLYASIAAASILAKTHRDAYMKNLHKEFPHYNWKQNKGYGTREHRDAIEKHGICKYHRKSFRLMPEAEQSALFEEEISSEIIVNPPIATGIQAGQV